MKPIDEKFSENLGRVATKGTKACEDFMEYDGADPRIHQRAKNGAEIIASYVKLLAIENARVALQASIDSGSPHKSTHSI
jgi:hypothetical protein